MIATWVRISVPGGLLRRMAALVNQHCALEAHDESAVLIEAAGLDRNDALTRAAVGLALVEDLAFGVERIAGKDRRRRLHLVPAEIGDDLGADRPHAHAGQDRERQRAVDERLFPLA